MFRKGLFLLVLTISALFMSAAGLTDDYVPPRIGECLEYKLFVKSMMHGADQSVRVVEATFYRERVVLVIQSKMDTVGLVQVLNEYHGTEESILDVEGLYPWVIRRIISDEDGSETEEVIFDYSKGTAVRTVSKN